MQLFWESIGGPAPVKLMNKANDAAVSNSVQGLKAAEAALEVSDSSAVKLTSLLGALFNHKDNKKGQQDTFKPYLGVMAVAWPGKLVLIVKTMSWVKGQQFFAQLKVHITHAIPLIESLPHTNM
ncbi:hypothetical protein B0H17DRAFT_1192246 [Mycena rosella]|uniref:Uncharacterized protein n=1 Tax=Mycena rosella TaxID=1033263 RepID=A0AAD7GWK6_MYCRO|nr:hypothetical protein B0H17DRAFT_1192246 [Mycena rosella]